MDYTDGNNDKLNYIVYGKLRDILDMIMIIELERCRSMAISHLHEDNSESWRDSTKVEENIIMDTLVIEV